MRQTVRHDGVTIPVTRGGRGRPLVLCPGLSSTQAGLHEPTGLLRRDHDVVTFDLRGHGTASAADRYTFDAFLGDLDAVLAQLDLPSPPLLVGYSLGADLAVHHAAGHPGSVAGLVLIDGANPLPEPFLNEADVAEFRALVEGLPTRLESGQGADAGHQVLLSGQDILDLNLELDRVRATLLDRYREIALPISMIMSSGIAGAGTEGHRGRHNALWRAGVERLVGELPDVSASWLDADHQLVFTHAPDIAEIINSTYHPAAG